MARAPAARRYAKALFELAREQGKLEAVYADLGELSKLLERRGDYMSLLSPYEQSAENRARVWRAILEGKADPLVLRFVLFLVHKNRAQGLGDIIGHFNARYHESAGILAAHIISAHPLSDQQVAAIAERFGKRLGKKIKPSLEIRPSLLGGFQVKIGDVVYDYSIDHQLNILHRKLVTA